MILNKNQFKAIASICAKATDTVNENYCFLQYDKELDLLCATDGHNMIIIKPKNSPFEKMLSFDVLSSDEIKKEFVTSDTVNLDEIRVLKKADATRIGKMITRTLNDLNDPWQLSTYNPEYLMKGYKVLKAFKGNKAYPPECLAIGMVGIWHAEIDDKYEFYQFLARVIL